MAVLNYKYMLLLSQKNEAISTPFWHQLAESPERLSTIFLSDVPWSFLTYIPHFVQIHSVLKL